MSELREIAKAIGQQQRAAAKSSPSQFVAKVVSSSGGYYTLQMPDGSTKRRIASALNYEHKADTYVTVDQTTEGLMQISAPGAFQSE